MRRKCPWNAIAIIATAVTLLSVGAAAQNVEIVGHWQGTMRHAGDAVEVRFDFVEQAGHLGGNFTSLPQRVLEYPLDDEMTYSAPKLHFTLGGGALTFDPVLINGILEGTFRDQELGEGSVRLVRITPPPPPYTSENVTFKNGDVTLSGSLYIPKSRGPHPALVFLQGSGPEVRWGANRFWSDFFGRRGIAALIYDKRGSGHSTGDWKHSDFDDLAGDALAGIQLLQTRHEIDAKRIGIYGHSQGGTIAPLVASRSKAVAFVLANAASGVPMWQSEIYSLHQSLVEAGISGDALNGADDFIRMMIQYARTGQGWEKLQDASNSSRQQSWAKTLELPPQNYYWWTFFRHIADYDSTEYWRQVKVPVLIIEPQNDERVPVERSVLAIHRALLAGGNHDFTVVIIPGAPHNLVIHPSAGEPFHWPYLAPGYADLLAAWVKYRTLGQ